MVFGKKKILEQQKKAGMITLISITSGHSYDYAYNPSYPPSQNLQRFLKEFDDEGFPMFFSDEKIPNLNVRTRTPDIEQRMQHYIDIRSKRLREFNPSTLDRTAQTKMEKQIRKKADTKAANAVKPMAKGGSDE
jgi:hypothetical protein